MADRKAKLDAIVRDLVLEGAALDSLLAGLPEPAWRTATPAAGWDVRDTVAHLAIGDELALECVRNDRVPKVMQDGLESILAGEPSATAFERKMLSRGRSMPAVEVHRWWRNTNAELCAELHAVAPDRRIPWGPTRMSPASFTTARMMETWAHGLDCFDAAGAEPVYTDRLRHIAELSVRALPYAFMINGRENPGPVRLELRGPGGDIWNVGPDDAATVIRGAASDWCRVATHRNRRGERERLHGEGPDATDVLKYVQAYL
jgi:uncharacterized protein (TIGR03084 family)